MKLQNQFLFFLLITTTIVNAQQTITPVTLPYIYPSNKQVAKNLEHWRDQKFGIIIHWGLYAQAGIMESWTLCNEDWIERDSNSHYDDYKKNYWGLSQKFNPTQFDPTQWATIAKNAGMKYIVFTTKHHDGFNMFDTKFSDFKITNGPFVNNKNADVTKSIFNAFRKEQFLIGAYFSKPDWHSQYFWWNKYATPNRNVNYDITKHPWRWNQFVNFTHNQLNELTTNYGKIDILWLDGGWVRPRNTVTQEVLNWGAPIPDFDQQIDMPTIASKVRKNQEGILIVDRTVHGEFENYKTPEQGIPKEASDEPWESCITLGNNWGYVPKDSFKTSDKIIHTLIEIVAKGGNLLLGIGPTAQGTLLPEQKTRLAEIGKWLQQFGEGIYNTRSINNFNYENIYFTKAKNNKVYVLPIFTKKNPLHQQIFWEGNIPKKGSNLYIVNDPTPLQWQQVEQKTIVTLTAKQIEKYKTQPAIVIKMQVE